MKQKRAFTPLETIKKHERAMVSLTGFTLVEIMIVIAIVATLVSLSVPNIMRSRVIANEGAGLANLKSIANACQAYHIDRDTFPDSLSALGETSPPYLAPDLADGDKQGYEFEYEQVSADSFTINANPTHTGLLRGKYFYADESGRITKNDEGPAGPDDEII